MAATGNGGWRACVLNTGNTCTTQTPVEEAKLSASQLR